MPDTFSAIFFIVYILLYLFIFAVSTLTYVFTAYGLFKMAKSCDLKYPWMSFFPVVSTYLVGQLADLHCRRNEKKKSSYAKILLWLGIAVVAVSVLMIAAVLVLIVIAAIEINASPMEDTAPVSVILLFLAVFILYFALLISAIVLTVFYYIALHKIFKLYTPEKSSNPTVFLVLSILCSLALPVILMLLSRKEPRFIDTAEAPDAGYTPVFTTDYSL